MKRKYLNLGIFAIFILLINLAIANELGKIIKFEGKVVVFRDKIPRHIFVKQQNFPLFIKDVVNTKSKSLAFIKFIDGSKVLLKEKSYLTIEGYRKLSLDKGKVIFKIRKRGGLKGATVKIKSIVIGVKGTTFLIDTSQGKTNIYLKEGLISVKNLTGNFKVYKSKLADEFENYKREFIEGINQEKEEFEEYKKQIQKEFVEFVREFDLKAGMAVSIDGNEVKQFKIPKDIEKEFENFEKLNDEI